MRRDVRVLLDITRCVAALLAREKSVISMYVSLPMFNMLIQSTIVQNQVISIFEIRRCPHPFASKADTFTWSTIVGNQDCTDNTHEHVRIKAFDFYVQLQKRGGDNAITLNGGDNGVSDRSKA